jgi:DNA-binding beta-propeller fold protein YncE
VVAYCFFSITVNLIYASTAEVGDDSEKIIVIDKESNKIVGNVKPNINTSSDMVLNPDANIIYSLSEDKLDVIDMYSGKLVRQIKVGQGALDVAFNPNLNTIYVTNSASGTVSVINSLSSSNNK